MGPRDLQLCTVQRFRFRLLQEKIIPWTGQDAKRVERPIDLWTRSARSRPRHRSHDSADKLDGWAFFGVYALSKVQLAKEAMETGCWQERSADGRLRRVSLSMASVFMTNQRSDPSDTARKARVWFAARGCTGDAGGYRHTCQTVRVRHEPRTAAFACE